MLEKKSNQEAVKKSKELALHYMETLVDVARESFLILSSDLRVISANPIFYKNFMVSPKETGGRFIYKLGDGQWDIAELRNLLEDILPKKKIVKNYEVKHVFPKIGERIIRLNARQIDSVQLIIFAMEDITEKSDLQKKLAEYTRSLEDKVAKRTAELADRVKELEILNKTMVGRELKMVELKEEIKKLQNKIRNGDGKKGNGKNGNGNY